MASFHKHLSITSCIIFLFLCFAISLSSALQVGFYIKSCPNAENVVRQVVQQQYKTDRSIPAALLRMHFHDCFVRGCDASILIDSTSNNQAEKDAGANGSVRGYELIDKIKAALEKACPQKVSCADIITLATRDAVYLAGGPNYNVPTGRRDGLISRASEVNLPGLRFTVSQAQQSFSALGLTINDMVVLLGAGHTIGVAHCNFFKDRLSNFQGTGSPDHTMDKALVKNFNVLCGSNPNLNPSTFLDQNTSFVFDNKYYNQIRKNRGILQIDQELALDSLSAKLVSNLAANTFISHANHLIQEHNPDLMFISKTKTSRAHTQHIIKDLPFNSYYLAEPEGVSGGILLLWNSANMDFSSVSRECHASMPW